MPHIAKPLADDRDGFRFRGGHAALDFTATLSGRLKDQRRELLSTPADLDRWLVASGLATRRPHSTEKDVSLARMLREAIFEVAAGRGSKAAREQLNAIGAARPATPKLTPSGEIVRDGTAAQFLSTLAQQAVELFGGPDSSRVRQCEGNGCAVLFLDLSRSGGRRWCSMDACGNRAKADAFRHRRR